MSKLGHIAILLASLACLTFSSCTSSKGSLTYMKQLTEADSISYASGNYDLKILPDDELVITVNSLIPTATAQYNLPVMNPATNAAFPSQTTPQQQTYVVNSNGDITFPVIGKLHVAGMTTAQLTRMLEERIGKDVVDPVVYVRLANFKVSVIGEVKQPGVQEVSRERFSVLDALAGAYDMTEYGDRSKVILIREENGKRTSHLLNLNDAATLESPYYYMQQNDVLVVEPNGIRQDNSKYNQNNSYKLQVISTIVSACSIIASLVIALAVK